MKGWAPRLALGKTLKVIRKWPINVTYLSNAFAEIRSPCRSCRCPKSHGPADNICLSQSPVIVAYCAPRVMKFYFHAPL